MIFMTGSFIGWVWECIYYAIKFKRWVNSGFMFGPVCPIYGVGVATSTALFCGDGKFRPMTTLGLIYLFVFCVVGSAILEWITSIVLEHWFHAVWWDYSDMPLNVDGRICLPASLTFGFAGLFVAKIGGPGLLDWCHGITRNGTELTAVVCVVLFTADLTLTVTSMSSLLEKIAGWKGSFDRKMEQNIMIVRDGPAAVVKAVVKSASGTVVRTVEFPSELYGRLTSGEKRHLETIREIWLPGRKEHNFVFGPGEISQESSETDTTEE
jgi:uncharacterized membrane protein